MCVYPCHEKIYTISKMNHKIIKYCSFKGWKIAYFSFKRDAIVIHGKENLSFIIYDTQCNSLNFDTTFQQLNL